MADINKMNRTWLCSVLFLDIVNYSSQSVELQIRWKDRFNGYLANAIRDTPEDERVILDTGDGAATCFLGAPEAAMFAALELWHSLILDERDQQPPFKVRIGINLGPVKLVRDINGAPNAIGDGMNAGQRIMSFAAENQILVSQSYFEVVSRLSDDYKNLFTLKGVETDKHIREHTVYHLAPPGAHGAVSVKLPLPEVPGPPAAPLREAVAIAPPAGPPQKKKSSSVPILVGVIVLVLAVSVAAAWHFASSAIPHKEILTVATTAPLGNTSQRSPAAPASQTAPAPAPEPASPAPAVTAASDLSTRQAPRQAVSATPVASVPEQAPAPVPAEVTAPVRATPRAFSPAGRTGGTPFATSAPALQNLSAADKDTAKELRERYDMDASRAANAWRNAEEIRRNLSAKGMSLNPQTAAALDHVQLFLDEAADALRDHKWDDALSSLQAVEAETQKVAKTVGN